MKIGIAGLWEFTGNYREALKYASFCLQAKGHSSSVEPFQTDKHTFAMPESEVSLSMEQAVAWDALILPGGGDIASALLPGKPAQDPHCKNTDSELDKRQMELLDYFVHAKKPVLGICKGMQLIGLYFGGNLCQHLPTAAQHCYLEHDQLHMTHAADGSFLQRLYGESFTVNSAHHQGFWAGNFHSHTLKNIACPGNSFSGNISVIQTAGDDVIEGISHNFLPVIGLQWHPERLCGRYAQSGTVDGRLVFNHLLTLINN